MADIKPRHYLYGILAFTLMSVICIAMLGELRGQKSSVIDESRFIGLNYSMNRYNDTYNKFNQLNTNIENTTSEGGGSAFSNLANAAWGTLKLMYNSFSFMTTTIQDIPNQAGLPQNDTFSQIANIVIFFIIVIITISILMIIFNAGDL